MVSILIDFWIFMVESVGQFEFGRSFIYLFWLLLFLLAFKSLCLSSKY